MAILRLLAIVAALLFFFGAAPLQWALMRCAPAASGRLWLPRAFNRTLLALLRIRIEARGAQPVSGGCLFVANHISWTDIIVFGAFHPFCFLAKREVSGWPFLGAFARVQQTVFVDRGKRRSILPANRQMSERLREGRGMLLFPEGTTHDGKALGRFFTSHFACLRDLLAMDAERECVPVQSIAIRYSSPDAPWIGDAALLPHLWQLVKGAPMRCELIFDTPQLVARGMDRKAVARQARARIAALLGHEEPSSAVSRTARPSSQVPTSQWNETLRIS